MKQDEIRRHLFDLELIATRHKRASDLKRFLLTDLEMLAERIRALSNCIARDEQEAQDINRASDE